MRRTCQESIGLKAMKIEDGAWYYNSGLSNANQTCALEGRCSARAKTSSGSSNTCETP